MARKAIKAVLIDISGTLAVGRKEIPGSAAALARLREAGLPVRFCTNTTQDTKASLVSLLRGIGLDVRPEEVFTSLQAARDLVATRGLRPFLLLHPDAEPEFEGIDTANPNTVVVGLAKEGFTYDRAGSLSRREAGRRGVSQPTRPAGRDVCSSADRRAGAVIHGGGTEPVYATRQNQHGMEASGK